MITTYNQAHRLVVRAKGRAKDHRCVDCGGPAAQWSYENTNGTHELVSPEGFPYSLSPEDYRPRCVSDHRKFDLQSAMPIEDLKRRMAAIGKLGGAKGGRATGVRIAQDPEFKKVAQATRSKGGRVNASSRRRCICGVVSTKSGIGTHQKASGCTGYTELPSNDEPIKRIRRKQNG